MVDLCVLNSALQSVEEFHSLKTSNNIFIYSSGCSCKFSVILCVWMHPQWCQLRVNNSAAYSIFFETVSWNEHVNCREENGNEGSNEWHPPPSAHITEEFPEILARISLFSVPFAHAMLQIKSLFIDLCFTCYLIKMAVFGMLWILKVFQLSLVFCYNFWNFLPPFRFVDLRNVFRFGVFFFGEVAGLKKAESEGNVRRVWQSGF